MSDEGMDRADAARLAMTGAKVRWRLWETNQWIVWSDQRASFVDEDGDQVGMFEMPRKGWERFHDLP